MPICFHVSSMTLACFIKELLKYLLLCGPVAKVQHYLLTITTIFLLMFFFFFLLKAGSQSLSYFEAERSVFTNVCILGLKKDHEDNNDYNFSSTPSHRIGVRRKYKPSIQPPKNSPYKITISSYLSYIGALTCLANKETIEPKILVSKD